MECAAKQYGDCTTWGKKEVDVLFLYRDKYGHHLPDETVKVCMCEAHRSVLEKYQEGHPLVMRGEEVDWALHDDLFTIFSNKSKTYTYVKIHKKSQTDSENLEYKYCLVNGRDIEWHGSVLLDERAEHQDVGPLCPVHVHFLGFRVWFLASRGLDLHVRSQKHFSRLAKPPTARPALAPPNGHRTPIRGRGAWPRPDRHRGARCGLGP